MNRIEHLLTCLAEEGGEVAKECSKAMRFGLDDKLTMDPTGPRGTEGPTNAEKIGLEMIDLIAVYQMLLKEGVVPDIGVTLKSTTAFHRIEKKKAKVEAYMKYADRVGALNAIPDLSSMACFRGMAKKPFRMLIEGPNGYSKIADADSIEDLLGFKVTAKLPPSYTADTMPNEPTPVYLTHPDYHQDQPPIVTVFPAHKDDDLFLVQWDDGTQDYAAPEDMRPLFWASLDKRKLTESTQITTVGKEEILAEIAKRPGVIRSAMERRKKSEELKAEPRERRTTGIYLFPPLDEEWLKHKCPKVGFPAYLLEDPAVTWMAIYPEAVTVHPSSWDPQTMERVMVTNAAGKPGFAKPEHLRPMSLIRPDDTVISVVINGLKCLWCWSVDAWHRPTWNLFKESDVQGPEDKRRLLARVQQDLEKSYRWSAEGFPMVPNVPIPLLSMTKSAKEGRAAIEKLFQGGEL